MYITVEDVHCKQGREFLKIYDLSKRHKDLITYIDDELKTIIPYPWFRKKLLEEWETDGKVEKLKEHIEKLYALGEAVWDPWVHKYKPW